MLITIQEVPFGSNNSSENTYKHFKGTYFENGRQMKKGGLMKKKKKNLKKNPNQEGRADYKKKPNMGWQAG